MENAQKPTQSGSSLRSAWGNASRYGIWIFFTWTSWMGSNSKYLREQLPWCNLYLGMTIALLAVVLIVLWRSPLRKETRRDEWKPTKILDWTCTVGLSLSCLVVAASRSSGADSSWAAASVILGGFSIGWMYIRWASAFTEFPIASMIRYLFIGVVIWSTVRIAFGFIPDSGTTALVALLPFAGCAMLHKTMDATAADRPAPIVYTPGNLITMRKMWIVLIAISLVLGLLAASNNASLATDPAASVIRRLLTIALCFGILVWTLKTNLSFDFALLWRIILFALAVSLLQAAVSPNGASIVGFLHSVVWDVLIPVIWLTVCDVARHSGISPYITVGVGLSSYSLSSFLGVPFYEFASSLASDSIIHLALMFCLLLVLGLCLDMRDPNTIHIFEDLRGNMPDPVEFQTIDDRCNDLGARYGLTARETEVMQLMCKGRSRSYIAETLFITENTVKTHIGHVYAKTDTHSKKELQQLIGV